MSSSSSLSASSASSCSSNQKFVVESKEKDKLEIHENKTTNKKDLFDEWTDDMKSLACVWSEMQQCQNICKNSNKYSFASEDNHEFMMAHQTFQKAQDAQSKQKALIPIARKLAYALTEEQLAQVDKYVKSKRCSF
jgi:hypothetical protein